MKKLLLTLILIFVLTCSVSASSKFAYNYNASGTSANITIPAIDDRNIVILGVTAKSDLSTSVLTYSFANAEGVTTSFTVVGALDVTNATKQFYYPSGLPQVVASRNTAVKLILTSTSANALAVTYDYVY